MTEGGVLTLDFSDQSDTSDEQQPEAATQADASDAPAAGPAGGTAFGLLFQAPDLEQRVPRRQTEVVLDDEDTDEDSSSGPQERDDAEGGDQGNRRRRRGGRGRRSGGRDEETETDAEDDSSSSDGPQGGGSQGSGSQGGGSQGGAKKSGKGGKAKDTTKDGDDSATEGDTDGGDSDGGGDSDEESGSTSRRRTRRRRRSGSGPAEGEDPPGTVTKVREPRKARDEVTSIKGSTRLEAKKQRRREGREAGRRRTVITEAEFLARRESVERTMVVREAEGRTQIGVMEDGVLVEHYVSRETQQASMAGNVYLGRVQNVLPSMEAAFVDIGRGRNAVLYAGEVNWDAAGLEGRPKRIENALKSGESVLVQVTKDPIGHKGARLTSQVSLPGRYLVYVPGSSMTGISRKLPDTERARLKKILKEVVPEDAGVIVRTAAEGASEAELKADVERLTKIWDKIQKKAKTASAPSLLHGEPDLTVRVIRDVFNEDFAKLIVAGNHAWEQVSDYVGSVAPDLADRLEKWTGEKDVFAVYRVDEQLAKAMDRKVWLPSGGSLIIDRTEAMTVIDVNTGKFVGSGGNLEETVTKNNIEAAEEIVRQMRLRDIGGIIVVDFIDMVLESNRDLVVRRLLECLGRDRTKHQVAEVTSLGLVQMTRKRVGTGLIEVFSEPCEHCGGRGIIVHDHPVDKGGNSSGGGNGSGGNGGGGGGGKGRSRKGGKVAPQEPAEEPAEKVDSNGRTAAQIAAAAHAAAMSAGEKPGVDSVVEAPVVPTPDAPVAAPAESPAATTPVVASVAAEAPARRPRRKRTRVVAPAGPPGAAPASTVTAASTADEPGDSAGTSGPSEDADA
ncbi:Rne/Rng family ribonuclease [Luteipulveratus sp. YIM 133296]|uniref:Rne/Rng family ribonuclease n=1 Tax=Luteipulveratus flavus TaxID=3031728 RepID=A0ABT6C5I0_9MICO|nr:Rne/Rng family ribonuclease [Luteipulveratus sp. YIM 133296]MDF8263319.1 Rne/Rng family ribonuclease [Luteipulveratus sp. YIM 133296]